MIFAVSKAALGTKKRSGPEHPFFVFILSGELVAKLFDIQFEPRCDHVSCSGSVILRVVSRSRIVSYMWQLLGNAELLRHKSPVLFQPLEAADEISDQISVRINKPIQLIAVRRRVNASATAVLDPVHKLLKCHFIF